MRNSRPVLLIEDDRVDIMMVNRAFKELKIPNPLVCVNDGQEALDYLRNNSNSRVCLILLDLNMPKMSGLEFLKVVKADDQLKKIPVVVLTTSDDPHDIEKSFKFSAAGYMTKPGNSKNFIEKIEEIKRYWTLSELPNGNIN